MPHSYPVTTAWSTISRSTRLDRACPILHGCQHDDYLEQTDVMFIDDATSLEMDIKEVTDTEGGYRPSILGLPYPVPSSARSVNSECGSTGSEPPQSAASVNSECESCGATSDASPFDIGPRRRWSRRTRSGLLLSWMWMLAGSTRCWRSWTTGRQEPTTNPMRTRPPFPSRLTVIRPVDHTNLQGWQR